VIYTWLFALVLARIDPERVHTAVSWVLRRLNRIRPLRSLARKLLFPIDERLKVRAIGLEFPTPLGLAAGFDKDAKTYDAYATLGFGCVEVGTVTAAAQPGNAGKRIFRIRGQQAVVNRMGFPNEGAAAVAQRLSARRDRAAVLGVNVGRSKSTAAEAANDDYQQSVRTLAPFADYLALNVSSPNTPGLRDMQAVDVLENLIKAVREALADISRNLPVLVKISPDLADEEIDAIADLAMQLELDGIIATNTTVDTGCLSSVPPEVSGGISGAPLKPRANAILRRLYGRTAGAVTLISVGGIDTPEEAWNRIAAGPSCWSSRPT